MLKVFICSPFRGDIKENTKRAAYYARITAKTDVIPIAPHLIFPAFLDENIPNERLKGIEMGLELMDICDEAWLFGFQITEGMKLELDYAREKQIPVRLYDRDFAKVSVRTISIDERVDENYRMAVNGLMVIE